MNFRRDPTKTESNCFAANAVQAADSRTAELASRLWATLANAYREDDPDEVIRCGLRAAAFYARWAELELEEAKR